MYLLVLLSRIWGFVCVRVLCLHSACQHKTKKLWRVWQYHLCFQSIEVWSANWLKGHAAHIVNIVGRSGARILWSRKHKHSSHDSVWQNFLNTYVSAGTLNVCFLYIQCDFSVHCYRFKKQTQTLWLLELEVSVRLSIYSVSLGV